MSFAPSSTYFDTGDGSIIGMFVERDTGNFFEFSENRDESNEFADYPHKIWVTTPREGLDSGFRYGIVLKTRLYIVVDEDADGNPVTEKWFLKERNLYERLESKK